MIIKLCRRIIKWTNTKNSTTTAGCIIRKLITTKTFNFTPKALYIERSTAIVLTPCSFTPGDARSLNYATVSRTSLIWFHVTEDEEKDTVPVALPRRPLVGAIQSHILNVSRTSCLIPRAIRSGLVLSGLRKVWWVSRVGTAVQAGVAGSGTL